MQPSYDTEKLLFVTSCILGILTIYLLLIFSCAYNTYLTIPVDRANRYFQVIIDRQGHINLYTLSCLLIASINIVSHTFLAGISKFSFLRNPILRIAQAVYAFLKAVAGKIIAFGQAKQYNSSLLFGTSYLLVSTIGAYVAVYYILPMEYWNSNLWSLTVAPIIVFSISYGTGFIASYFLPSLDLVFPRNIIDTDVMIIELCRFIAILLGGIMIMFLPIITHCIEIC